MIYLLTGTNAYQKNEYVKSMQSKFKSYASFVLQCTDTVHINRSFLDELLYSVSLFDSSQKIIHLKDYTQFIDQTYLEKILPDFEKTTQILLVLNTQEKIRSNAKILKLIQNNQTYFFDSFKPVELTTILQTQIESSNINSTNTAEIIHLLLERVDNDPYNLSNELQKVMLYSSMYSVSKEAVIEITIPSMQHDIWEYLQNLLQGKRSEAVKTVVNLLEKGENEHAIIAMILWNIRLILIAKSDITKTAEQIAKDFSYNPYSVKNAKQAMRNISFQKIIAIYESLARIQLKTKNGLLEPRLGLIVFSALF